MKRWMAALGACAALATLSGGAFAHGCDPDGNALRGAVAGGLVRAPPSPGVVTPSERGLHSGRAISTSTGGPHPPSVGDAGSGKAQGRVLGRAA
jgi:hypothetical protein